VSAYLFDTCVISKWYERDPIVESYVQALPGNCYIYISCVSLGEIEFGNLKVTGKRPATNPAVQTDFRRWISETFDVPALSIMPSTAQSYAIFKRRLCDKFVPNGRHIQNAKDAQSHILGIDENDLWLVSQAHDQNLTFVTTDEMPRIAEVVDGAVRVEFWLP